MMSDQVWVDVHNDVLRISEKIVEYDPNLVLKFLDPGLSEDINDAPWALFEKCKDGVERLVFYIWELNDTVLERLYLADMQKHDIQARLEKKNAQARKDRQRRYQEQRDEARDLVHHIIRSPKTSYTAKIDDRIVKFE